MFPITSIQLCFAFQKESLKKFLTHPMLIDEPPKLILYERLDTQSFSADQNK